MAYGMAAMKSTLEAAAQENAAYAASLLLGSRCYGGAVERRLMFQRLYHWTLSLAESPHAPWALGIIAFAESSFFPIPPDVILVPMCLARPPRAWAYAALCTVASVAGGALGYAIGALLFDTVGHWLIPVYFMRRKLRPYAILQDWGAPSFWLRG